MNREKDIIKQLTQRSQKEFCLLFCRSFRFLLSTFYSLLSTHSKKIISISVCLIFLTQTLLPSLSYAQSSLGLPAPGTAVALSLGFVPTILRGIRTNAANPFEFDFIVDVGDAKLEGEAFNKETERLVKYFLASLTMPEDDLWVNLSPYEKDRIVPEGFGQTEMGRDLLAQDYLLKQITASLINPDSDLGKEFWAKVYKKAFEQYGTTNVPVDTFNKVWIMPQKAVVYENGDKAFIVESRLKVMLESDYLAEQKNSEKKLEDRGEKGEEANPNNTKDSSSPLLTSNLQPLTSDISSSIVREVFIPALEKEVNEGKNFANLRQIYHSLILATWFKETLKDSILNKVYSDKRKVEGLRIEDRREKGEDRKNNEKNLTSNIDSQSSVLFLASNLQPLISDVNFIYQQYLAAYKKGVCNMMKVEYDPYAKKAIPRKYFSGGFNSSNIKVAIQRIRDGAFVRKIKAVFKNVKFKFQDSKGKEPPEGSPSKAVNQEIPDVFREHNIEFFYKVFPAGKTDLRNFIAFLLSLVPGEVLDYGDKKDLKEGERGRQIITKFLFGMPVPRMARPDVGNYDIEEKMVTIDSLGIAYWDLFGLARLILHEIGHSIESHFSSEDRASAVEFYNKIKAVKEYRVLLPSDEENILDFSTKSLIRNTYLREYGPNQFLAEFFRQFVLNGDELRDYIASESNLELRQSLQSIYDIFYRKVGKEFGSQDIEPLKSIMDRIKSDIADGLAEGFDKISEFEGYEGSFMRQYGLTFDQYKDLRAKNGQSAPTYEMMRTVVLENVKEFIEEEQAQAAPADQPGTTNSSASTLVEKIRKLYQDPIGDQFSDFVAWVDAISATIDRPVTDAEMKEIADAMGISKIPAWHDLETIRDTAKTASNFTRFIQRKSANTDAYNIYFFRDEALLYLAGEKEKKGFFASNKVFESLAGGQKTNTLPSAIHYLITEAKLRMDLKERDRVPEDRFAKFEEEFFAIFNAFTEGRILESPRTKLINEHQAGIQKAAEGFSKYFETLNISWQEIEDKGIRFIDTTETGSYVLFMKALILQQMEKAGFKKENILNKVEGFMFYSKLSQGLSALPVETDDMNMIRAVEFLGAYPVEFSGGFKNGMPLIREKQEAKRDFLFYTLNFKNELLKQKVVSSTLTLPVLRDMAMGLARKHRNDLDRNCQIARNDLFDILGGNRGNWDLEKKDFSVPFDFQDSGNKQAVPHAVLKVYVDVGGAGMPYIVDTHWPQFQRNNKFVPPVGFEAMNYVFPEAYYAIHMLGYGGEIKKESPSKPVDTKKPLPSSGAAKANSPLVPMEWYQINARILQIFTNAPRANITRAEYLSIEEKMEYIDSNPAILPGIQIFPAGREDAPGTLSLSDGRKPYLLVGVVNFTVFEKKLYVMLLDKSGAVKYLRYDGASAGKEKEELAEGDLPEAVKKDFGVEGVDDVFANATWDDIRYEIENSLVKQMGAEEALKFIVSARAWIVANASHIPSEKSLSVELAIDKMDRLQPGIEKDVALKKIAQRNYRTFFDVNGWMAENYSGIEEAWGHVTTSEALYKIIFESQGKLLGSKDKIFVNSGGQGQMARVRLLNSFGGINLIFAKKELEEAGFRKDESPGEVTFSQDIPLKYLTVKSKKAVWDVILNYLELTGEELSGFKKVMMANALGFTSYSDLEENLKGVTTGLEQGTITDEALSSVKIKGGVDFNLANLNIERKGEGSSAIPFDLNNQDFEDLQVDGLYPVIINVAPVTNLPLLLGVFEEEAEGLELSKL